MTRPRAYGQSIRTQLHVAPNRMEAMNLYIHYSSYKAATSTKRKWRRVLRDTWGYEALDAGPRTPTRAGRGRGWIHPKSSLTERRIVSPYTRRRR